MTAASESFDMVLATFTSAMSLLNLSPSFSRSFTFSFSFLS